MNWKAVVCTSEWLLRTSVLLLLWSGAAWQSVSRAGYPCPNPLPSQAALLPTSPSFPSPTTIPLGRWAPYACWNAHSIPSSWAGLWNALPQAFAVLREASLSTWSKEAFCPYSQSHPPMDSFHDIYHNRCLVFSLVHLLSVSPMRYRFHKSKDCLGRIYILCPPNQRGLVSVHSCWVFV